MEECTDEGSRLSISSRWRRSRPISCRNSVPPTKRAPTVPTAANTFAHALSQFGSMLTSYQEPWLVRAAPLVLGALAHKTTDLIKYIRAMFGRSPKTRDDGKNGLAALVAGAA